MQPQQTMTTIAWLQQCLSIIGLKIICKACDDKTYEARFYIINAFHSFAIKFSTLTFVPIHAYI